MAFVFVHTADWQIGKPFGRFEPGKAGVLSQVRLEVIDRIAQVAASAGAAHVLVAGDVFDGEVLPDRMVTKTLIQMGRHRTIHWHLLPGNHDPARLGGVWHNLKPGDIAPNVHPHLFSAPAQMAPGVVLLPAPLRTKATSTDPTQWMDDAATPSGTIRIGLAHGSVRGFGSLGESAVPVDPGRVHSAGLAYLAMGDWHGLKQINDRVWYSGTPEPDSFSDNDPGHVLVVRIADAESAPDVEARRTASYRWLQRQLRIARPDDLAPVEAELAQLEGGALRTLVHIVLEGSLMIEDEAELQARLQRLEAMVFNFSIERSGLRVSASEQSIEALGGGALRAVAARLKTKADSPDAEESRVGRHALGLLFSLAGAGMKARRS